MSREIEVEVLPSAGAPRRPVVPRERSGCGLLVIWVTMAWGLELFDTLLPGVGLDLFGIYPRHLAGLPGVVLSPFLHGGFGHLFANTLAFLGLGMLVLAAEGQRFAATTFSLVLISGMGTWLIGRPSVHIGASGLIYGYFGYLLGRAIWERHLGWALLGVFVGLVYGGMIFGVLPTRGMISWEGHLAGLVAGLWLGWTHVKEREEAERS